MLQPDKPFVTVCAIAREYAANTAGTNRAKPLRGAGLPVKHMLYGRANARALSKKELKASDGTSGSKELKATGLKGLKAVGSTELGAAGTKELKATGLEQLKATGSKQLNTAGLRELRDLDEGNGKQLVSAEVKTRENGIPNTEV